MPRYKDQIPKTDKNNTGNYVQEKRRNGPLGPGGSQGHLAINCPVKELKLCSVDCKVTPNEAAVIPLVVCGLCEKWFHFRCLGLPEGKVDSVRGLYYCDNCSQVFKDMRKTALQDRDKDKRLEKLERLFIDFSADYKSIKGQLDLLDQGDRQSTTTEEAPVVNRNVNARRPGQIRTIDPHDQALLDQSCEKLRRANAEMKNLILREKNATVDISPLVKPTSKVSPRLPTAAVPLSPRSISATPLREPVRGVREVTASLQLSVRTRSATPNSVSISPSPSRAHTKGSAVKSVWSGSSAPKRTAFAAKTVSAGPASKRTSFTRSSLQKTVSTNDVTESDTDTHPLHSKRRLSQSDESDTELPSEDDCETNSLDNFSRSSSRKKQRTHNFRQNNKADRVRFPKRNVPAINYNEKRLFNVEKSVFDDDDDSSSAERREHFPKRNIPPKNYDENAEPANDDPQSPSGPRKILFRRDTNESTTSGQEADKEKEKNERFSLRKVAPKKYNVDDDEDDVGSDSGDGIRARRSSSRRSKLSSESDSDFSPGGGAVSDNDSDQARNDEVASVVDDNEVANRDSDSVLSEAGDEPAAGTSVEIVDIAVDNEDDRTQALTRMCCSLCQKSYVGVCPTHGLVTFIKDNNDSSRGFLADNTIPVGLNLRVVGGIWTSAAFDKGAIFGPYKGLEYAHHLYKDCSSKYCWHIFHSKIERGRHVDGRNLEKSNWMRYVRRVGENEVANLAAIQLGDQIYFRAVTDIKIYDQLLVGFDHGYRKSLDTNTSTPLIAAVVSESSDGQLTLTVPSTVPAPTKSQPTEGDAKMRYCPHCDWKSSLPKPLLTHLATHTEERPFSCRICGFDFKMVCDLENHSRVVHKRSAQYECKLCGLWFQDVQQIQKHQKNSHKASYNCPDCNRGFFYETSLFLHQVINHDPVTNRARSVVAPNAENGWSGSRQADLPVGELTSGSPNPSSRTDLCNERETPSSTAGILNEDGRLSAEGELILPVNLSEEEISKLNAVPSNDVVLSIGDVDIPKIRRSSRKRGFLLNKNRFRNAGKPADVLPPCDLCSFKGDTVDQCKEHLFGHYLENKRSTTGVYKCHECIYARGLAKTFKTHLYHHARDKYMKRMANESLQPPLVEPAQSVLPPCHSCRICGKTFVSFSRLERHRVRRHGNRKSMVFKFRHPHKCQLCRRRWFATRDHLDSHWRAKHPKKSNFPCLQCHQVFLYESSRQFHVRRKHCSPAQRDESLSLAEGVTEIGPVPASEKNSGQNLSSQEMQIEEPVQDCLASVIDQTVSIVELENNHQQGVQSSNNQDIDEGSTENGAANDFESKLIIVGTSTSKSKVSSVRRIAKKKLAPSATHFCQKCARSYSSTACRDSHVARVHSTKLNSLVCGVCKASFSRPSALKKHEYDELISKTQCPVCGLPMLLRCHLTTHKTTSLRNISSSSADGAQRCLRRPVEVRSESSRLDTLQSYIDEVINRMLDDGPTKSSAPPPSATKKKPEEVDLFAQLENFADSQPPATSNNSGQESWPPEWNIPAESYGKDHVIEEDDLIYCDDCEEKKLAGCSIHGPFNLITDTEVSDDEMQKALKSLPKGFFVEESSIKNAGLGVWSNAKVMKGTVFGPYKGVITYESHETCQSDYCWHIVQKGKPSYCIDGKQVTFSNWMRYINCANNDEQQNMTAFQYKGQIFYRTLKNIQPGTELLVWYGKDFAKILGLDPDQDESEEGCDVDVKAKRQRTSKSSDYDARWEESLEILTSKCNICGFTTTDVAAMKNHLLEHCYKAMPSTSAVKSRVKCCNAGCNYVDLGNGWFKEHLYSHTGSKPFRCRECGFCLRTRSSFQLHVSKHRNSALFCNAMNRFKCHQCSKMFSSKASLSEHHSTEHHSEHFSHK